MKDPADIWIARVGTDGQPVEPWVLLGQALGDVGAPLRNDRLRVRIASPEHTIELTLRAHDVVGDLIERIQKAITDRAVEVTGEFRRIAEGT